MAVRLLQRGLVDDSSPIRLHQADVRLQPSAGLVERRTGYTAEHAKISAKQGAIGLSRLARRFGDPPTYDYGVYLLAKALINEWAWTKAAVPYATNHTPWFHPTDTEWIAHENHGYAGIEGMPLDQVRTYQEIPLVTRSFQSGGTRGLQRFLRAHAASIRTE